MKSGTALLLLASSVACYSEVRTLTLDEALSLAEKHNPQLRAASASVEVAQAGIVTAKAYANPSITFGSLGRQHALMSAGIPGTLHGLNFSQPIELSNLRSTRIKVAEAGRDTREFALAESRLAVRGAVKQRFYEAIRNEALLEVAKGNLELLLDLRRRIGVQVEVGEAARLELTRAEAEAAGARIQVRSAELRLSAAISALAAAIGTPLNQVRIEGALERTAILPTLEELRNEMIRRHPTLAVAESERRRAEATVANERAQRIPQPNVWMDWFQQPEAAQYRVGVTVTLPVFNRREGQIAQAQAEERQTTAIANQRRIELTAALEQAYNLYHVATQQLQIFEDGTLRQAEAAVEAAQAAFKFGERGIIEVLDAQRVLRAARQEYLNAQFDRQQALIQLEQLRSLDIGDLRP